MPSPQRIFRRFSTLQIQQLIQTGFDSVLNGRFSSVSGSAKSGSLDLLPLETLLFEANYELGIRNGTGLPSKVQMDLTGYK